MQRVDCSSVIMLETVKNIKRKEKKRKTTFPKGENTDQFYFVSSTTMYWGLNFISILLCMLAIFMALAAIASVLGFIVIIIFLCYLSRFRKTYDSSREITVTSL